MSASTVRTAVVCPPFPGARFAPAVNSYATYLQNYSSFAKCSAKSPFNGDIPVTSAGTSVVHEKGPTVHGCSTGVGIIPGNS